MTRRRSLPLLVVVSLAVAGCGTTEESGEVGDVLSAEGLKAQVKRVDSAVPVPANDITGLSSPAPGSKLVGVLVSVCSDHGGALGAFDFGLESSDGDGRLKFPQMNYAKEFDSFRADCGDGWVVFEIPEDSSPEKVTFDFEDTGTARDNSSNVDAHFSWSVG